ncbi:MAG: hypothetical protein DRI34_06475 [Deltaproteobacteria bacterium]|nr:MAG: hypothetical protein DRI34_06475 [Deltaproteobacteria bacterium]
MLLSREDAKKEANLAPLLQKYHRRAPPGRRRVLFTWLVVLMLANGCIISPDIEEEPAEPLYPPQILTDTVEPADTAAVFDLDSGCSPAVFRVGQVRDYNQKDILYARWLEDWREDKTKEQWVTTFIYPLPGQIDRPGLSTSLVLDGYAIDSVHSLRFFVADRPPRNDGNGMQLPADSDGQVDWIQWTFRVAPAGSGICAWEQQP